MNTSTLLLSDFELMVDAKGCYYRFRYQYTTNNIASYHWPFHRTRLERITFLRTFLPDNRILQYWFPYSETEEEAFVILLKCIGEYNKKPFTKIHRDE